MPTINIETNNKPMSIGDLIIKNDQLEKEIHLLRIKNSELERELKKSQANLKKCLTKK